MRFFSRICAFFSLLLKRLLLLAEIVLFLRLLLKFLGANPNAFAVGHFYKYTDFLVWPFKGIFPNVFLGGGLIETATLSAMVGYAIIVFILVKLFKTLSNY